MTKKEIIAVLEEAVRETVDDDWPGYILWRIKAEQAIDRLKEDSFEEWHSHMK